MMDDLLRFQRGAGAILAGSLLAAGGAAVLAGHAELVTGVTAGALLGFVNLRWLVGTARRLSGVLVTSRLLQAAALVRWLVIGGLLGAALAWGHVHPIGAVIGYGLFPISAAAAGFLVLRAPARLAR